MGNILKFRAGRRRLLEEENRESDEDGDRKSEVKRLFRFITWILV